MLKDVKWCEYHLYDLFYIYSGNKFDKSKMTAFDPAVNFVGRSSKNNGVTAYVDYVKGVKPYPAGCMTIALGGEYLGSCFIQQHPFYTSQNVFVLSDKEHMDENVKLFIAHLIRFESKNNYMAFARELNSHIKTDFKIKLPSIKEGVLDHDFINRYMNGLNVDITSIPDIFLNEGYDRACWYIDNIDKDLFNNEYSKCREKKAISLQNKEWAYFSLEQDLNMEIYNGKSYNASDLIKAVDENYVLYITRKDERNGISMYVQPLEYDGLEKANAITVGDTTATIFYQNRKFITGPHIIILRADWLNIYTAEFIITLLNKEKYRYPVFGRAFTKDLIKQTKLYLPVNENNKPDFNFMEEYIKSLPFSIRI